MVTAWNKIKKEYLEGVTPKELSLKYKIKAKTISDKATKEKWTIEKAQICVNVLQKTEDKITSLTNKALDTCDKVMDDPNASYKDKLTAANIAISVSGLKKDKQEITTNQPAVNLTINKADIKEIANDINDLADE